MAGCSWDKQGDEGTRGRGDEGTRGRGDEGTRGRGDEGLDAEAVFEGADAVAGYGELGALGVPQSENDFAGEPGIDFVDPVDVDER
jgi:hypothetical protein